MKIELEEIRRIAKLSRIMLSESEEKEALHHFDMLLEQMRTIDAFDASTVSPTANILGEVNVLREDEIQPSMDRQLLLKNAADRDESAYIVPRVVE